MPRLSATARVVLVILAAVLLGALAVAAWRQARAAELPTGRAEWIWRDVGQAVGPTAFYAVRDFPLAERPREARLLVLADEEYVLTLNGHRVGSNRYRPGTPLDVYPVADLLLEGPNRLLVELRSSRGAGGFLAAVEVVDAAGTVARPVVSDRTWHLVPRHRVGLREGWQPVAADPSAGVLVEEPVSWGRPPTGRWDFPRRGDLRPRAAEAGDPCAGVPAASVVGEAPGRVVFDFGREVVGYLAVRHPPLEADGLRVEAALVATGDGPPEPLAHPAEAVPLLPVPGNAEWTDTVPRRFRYAAVVGLDGPLEAAVLPVTPAALPALPGALTGEAAAPALLGLTLPGRRTPVEDAVRRRLQEP